MVELAHAVRVAADGVWTLAGSEYEADATGKMARHKFLRGVASELHRLARLLEDWEDR